jgi:hypothetical protein
MKYYKQALPSLMTFFCVNEETRNVECMFREYKSSEMLSLSYVHNLSMWDNVDNNELSRTLIQTSVEIKKEEYEAAEFIMKAMVESEYWIIAEEKCVLQNPHKSEVVTEPVYC